MPPLRMSSGESIAVRAYDSLSIFGTAGRKDVVPCIVGVAWEVWSHAVSVIVVEACKAGVGGARGER